MQYLLVFRMFGKVPRKLPLFILLAGAIASPSVSGDDARRYPTAGVPLVGEAPVIDGVVDPAEWRRAAQLGPLKEIGEGVADGVRRDVLVAADAENLYVGFRLERPADALVPQAPEETGRVDSYRMGDFVEIMVDPESGGERYFGFVVYPNGAYADVIGSPDADLGWNPAWRQAAGSWERGWQGEVAIPFEILGLSGPPEDGTVFHFEFIDNRRTPWAHAALWGYRGSEWHRFANSGRLVFAGGAPAGRFVNGGEPGLAAVFEVAGAATNPTAPVEYDWELRRRKDGPEGGEKSFFDAIEHGVAAKHKRIVDGEARTAPLEKRIAETLEKYEVIADGGGEVSPPADGARRLEIAGPEDEGEYLLLYAFRRPGENAPLMAGALPYRIGPDIPVLEIIEPAERMVAQRNAEGFGLVPVAGVCRIPRAKIEARWVDGADGGAGDWTLIAEDAGRGEFAGYLRVPEGGWHAVEIRASLGRRQLAEAEVDRVGVGEVFVTAGQSNSANYGKRWVTAGDDRVSSWGPGGWRHAADPQPLARYSLGSPWPALGDLLVERLDVPVAFISTGWGGSAVESWADESGVLYQRLRYALRQLGPGGARAVLWHQGEANVARDMGAEEYAGHLRRLIRNSRVEAGYAVPWLIAQVGFYGPRHAGKGEGVRRGQLLATEMEGVHAGPDTDTLSDVRWRVSESNAHFNEAGLHEHARLWAERLEAVFFDANAPAGESPADGRR